MPVISLPEFLGIQEAPQRPVFQRTRQIEPQSQWDRDMQVADAVTALRQQRPLSQIQAIQNEYDTISSNADKLRREREATIQAEQAVSALAGLTPESEDYLNQRRQLQTQFPSAMLDPRVQRIIDDSDRMYQVNQSKAEAQAAAKAAAQAAQEREMNDNIQRFFRAGGNPQQLEGIKSPAQVAYLEGQLPKASRGGMDMEERRLRGLVDTARQNAEIVNDALSGASDEEIQAASKQHRDALNALGSYYSRLGQPVEPTRTAPASVQGVDSQGLPVSVNPDAVGFRSGVAQQPKQIPVGASVVPGMGAPPASKTGGKTAPTTEEVPVKTYVDEIKSLDLAIPGSANILSQFSKSDDLPMEARKEIVKKLADAVKNPPSMKHLSTARVDAIKEEISDAYQFAKKNLDIAETIERDIAPTWTKAKKEMEPMVEKFAKENGYDTESVWLSLAEEEYNADQPMVADRILGKNLGIENPTLKAISPKIEAVRNQQAPIGSWVGRIFGGEKLTNFDVLKTLAGEKVKAIQSSPQTSVESPLKAGQKVRVGSATITKRE